MNVELARFNMIEQQIRPWDVLDDRVLTTIAAIPRESFVADGDQTLAFADINLPIGHQQVMMAPKVEARLLQALAPTEGDTVLEIGTGSGFFTALLAKMAGQVYSVDIYADFTTEARHKLAAQGLHNVTLETGDASLNGWPKHGPYDAIAITGSYPVLPEGYQRSLKMGGRLVAIVGEAPVMEAILITRIGEAAWSRESLFETVLPPLRNAYCPPSFVF